MIFDAILDGMEIWYGKDRTRGQVGFIEHVYNFVLEVPGLQDVKKEKVRHALNYLVSKYKDDQAALGTSGNDGEYEYFKRTRKRKVVSQLTRYRRMHVMLHKESSAAHGNIVEASGVQPEIDAAPLDVEGLMQ